MTRRLDLGPILAIAGAVVAGVAIIAGFIVVGGPGHARNQRLDEITEQRISTIVSVVQCAFNSSGLAPLTLDAAKGTPNEATGYGYDPPTCGGSIGPDTFTFELDDSPMSPGSVSYAASTSTHVKICGNFRAARDGAERLFPSPYGPFYPQLDETRGSGLHCYELDLVSTKGAPSSKDGRYQEPVIVH